MGVSASRIEKIQDGEGNVIGLRFDDREFLFSEISGYTDSLTPTQKQNLLPSVISTMQEFHDVREKRNTLPNDDPNRNTDPNLENQFHDGADIVYRGTIILAEWPEDAPDGIPIFSYINSTGNVRT